MRLSVLLFALVVSLTTMAQKLSFPNQQLAASWEVIENNYAGKRQFLAAFTFKNNSNVALPATGWSLFFNFPRLIYKDSVSPQVRIEHINGDFYRLTPTAAFKGLAPKDSLVVTYVAGAWAVNITDAPGGLYIVWDDMPEKGYTLTNYTVKPTTQRKQYMRYNDDKVERVTAERIYAQNASIVDLPENSLPKVFPTPVSYTEGNGSFLLDNKVQITADNRFEKEAQYLQQELKPLIGELGRATSNANGKQIQLLYKEMPNEAYELTVTSTAITITAGSAVGVFYGIQSLKSALPVNAWKAQQKSLAVPAMTVADAPRFPYRSFMLDVARNFQTKEEIFKTLDLLALYKLNVFHFHFSDDEGWRVEIPGLPELTSVGGRRGHASKDGDFLHPSFGSGPDFNTSGTGHYTRQDYIDILKYAKERHIRVIPEIETPGHARAAIASMTTRYNRLVKEGKPKEAAEYLLVDLNDSSEYRSVQRWTNNVINPAMPSAYRFMEKVTDELIAMYKDADAPLERIHFGGDEVPAGVWTKSPAVKALMQKDSSVKEVNDLWYYFFGHINDMLKRKGLLLYGWEEIAMRKTKRDGKAMYIPNPTLVHNNIQVDVWNNVIGWGSEDLPYQLANAGYKVILSPVSNMYFDLSYQKEFDEPGQYWGGFLDMDKPFYFIPFDYYKNSTRDIDGNVVNQSFFENKARLTDYGKEQIPGLQGLLWAETLTSAAKMEYLLLPKLLSLSERAWSKDPTWATEKDSTKAQALYTQAWSQFVNVLGKRELPRLDYFKGGFQYRIPTPGIVNEGGTIKMNTQIPGFAIYYTTDGSEPTLKSKRYSQPVPATGTIRARLFTPSGRAGRTVAPSLQKTM
ncbi:family 20 glycosylhydrolase [Flavisolibacter tropicus]|uniref:beta-N-acetylhexosaminidase n=1 Tax=Flavisolibacter tropicus TaxID=1492898 RepID=A0A172U3D6_9BACT|nr:family 20 glycosylhydrolase [Flavisolibacter tropicus]ANE53678.1 beta-N-acetylhexosaminidase [Flavisolibacter tropicus]